MSAPLIRPLVPDGTGGKGWSFWSGASGVRVSRDGRVISAPTRPGRPEAERRFLASVWVRCARSDFDLQSIADACQVPYWFVEALEWTRIRRQWGILTCPVDSPKADLEISQCLADGDTVSAFFWGLLSGFHSVEGRALLKLGNNASMYSYLDEAIPCKYGTSAGAAELVRTVVSGADTGEGVPAWRLNAPELEHAGVPRWAEMREIALPLSQPVKTIHSVGRGAGDEGVAIGYPHRQLTDGRVFSTRRRAPGAAVLVDVSGSMGFTADDVDEILQLCRGSVVAIYGMAEGWPSARPFGEEGFLCVVGRDTRRVAQSQLDPIFTGHAVGNGVDGPALRWLSRQRGARYWLSDGMVTGRDEEASAALSREAESLRVSGVTMRVGSVTTLRERICGKKGGPKCSS